MLEGPKPGSAKREDTSEKSTLSVGIIVGIVIGSVLFISVIVLIIVCVPRRTRKEVPPEPSVNDPPMRVLEAESIPAGLPPNKVVLFAEEASSSDIDR